MSHHFDPFQHTCRRDVLEMPQGLLLIIKWAKTIQTVGTAPVLPIPEIRGHPTDPVVAYRGLVTASKTTNPNQPLLTMGSGRARTVVTIPILVNAFKTSCWIPCNWIPHYIHCIAQEEAVPHEPTRQEYTKLTSCAIDYGSPVPFGPTSPHHTYQNCLWWQLWLHPCPTWSIVMRFTP